jgi:hypothetical protein
VTQFRVGSVNDGALITVNDAVNDPQLIPSLVLNMVDQMFVGEQILRDAGGDQNTPAAIYYESEPLFADSDSEYVEEYAEIPVATTSRGTPRAVRTRRRGLAITISEDMQQFNQVDQLNKQLLKVRNTLVKNFDSMWMTAILAAVAVGVHTRAATAAFSSGSAKIRKDVLLAVKDVTDEQRGDMPDTLLINPSSRIDILSSAEITSTYTGNMADQNPLLTGQVGPIFNFAGLDVWQSYQMPTGQALIFQRKKVGFYKDTRPLRVTPTYKINQTETYRADITRASMCGIDEPKCATLLTGI